MMLIFPVHAFQDNYIWLIQDQMQQVTIVDPGQAKPVLDTLKKQHLKPQAILITHHHGDHIGGIQKILKYYPDIPVFGPARENIPYLTKTLKEGDIVSLPAMKICFTVFDVPGHTAGHIAYYTEGSLFCGDTLFSVGCGRVFDGSMQQLHQSLNRLAKLPHATKVYCAHEYTLDNIGFAKWVEPNNSELLAREAQAHQLQDEDTPSIPSTIGMELATNPFLRTHHPQVIRAAENYAKHPLTDSVDIFTTLRQWKDCEYD